MQTRKVTGEERERLLGAKTTSGFDAGPYIEVLQQLDEGEVAAVQFEGSERGEKIRFSRAATRIGKSINWLRNPSENEIAFQVVEQRQPGQQRGRRRRERAD